MPNTDSLPEPMPLAGDTARTRTTDPVTSHQAADKSQARIKETKMCVLRLIRQEGSLTGQEVNDLYLLRASRSDWPAAKYDTPRKRAFELLADGFLAVLGERDGGRELCLTAKGCDALKVTS